MTITTGNTPKALMGDRSMSKLSYARRQKMPSSEFALPGRGTGPKGKGGGSYPIPDASHARNALARVAQHGSPEEKAEVRSKVRRKFPAIGHHDGRAEAHHPGDGAAHR